VGSKWLALRPDATVHENGCLRNARHNGRRSLKLRELELERMHLVAPARAHRHLRVRCAGALRRVRRGRARCRTLATSARSSPPPAAHRPRVAARPPDDGAAAGECCILEFRRFARLIAGDGQAADAAHTAAIQAEVERSHPVPRRCRSTGETARVSVAGTGPRRRKNRSTRSI
jgi:hypothetical protein